ncbi:Rad9-domain-containing protein [Crassisporium funariophilum]|nr:Rad9-domain-containing protein [Crassisporium funariophilum]
MPPPSKAAFAKALTCLSRYGDDLSIYATQDFLSFSAPNSSKSAYCRFKYHKEFFSRYRLGQTPSANEGENSQNVTAQLMTKSLLSILKHRTVEKAVETCELSIVEGILPTEEDSENEDQDGLESKLIVRLHCKLGVVKTHRLLLSTPASLMAPGVPDAQNESRLTIGPRALRDLIDHFPVSKGARSDPQLVWTFEDTEVGLKSLESAIDSRGKGQLSTELTISADTFDAYDIFTSPTTIAFHLREFNASIAFADSMSLPLELRFTDPAAPLFIDIEGDHSETLFVIATSQVQGAPTATQPINGSSNPKKRERERTLSETPRIKKPMKLVQTADPDSLYSRSTPNLRRSESTVLGSMPPPSIIPRPSFSQVPQPDGLGQNPSMSYPEKSEPLFLPSSQMSAADEEVLRSTGLGVELMDADELAEMLDGEGEEVDFSYASQAPPGLDQSQPTRIAWDTDMAIDDPDSFELVDEGVLSATQSSNDISRSFQPLFED